MSNEIIKVVDALAAKLGVAIDWTATNVMPYLQQLMERYIAYEVAMAIYGIVVSFAITVIFLVLTICLYSKVKKVGFDDFTLTAVLYVCCVICLFIAAIIFVILAFTNIHQIITCSVLPEKVVFDYLSTLMNGAV